MKKMIKMKKKKKNSMGKEVMEDKVEEEIIKVINSLYIEEFRKLIKEKNMEKKILMKIVIKINKK